MKKENFSDRLRQALSIREITASELVRRTNISKCAISQYLSNKFAPRQNRIYEIAKALRVSPAWLMGFDVPMEDEEWYNSEKNKSSFALATNNISDLSAELRELVNAASDLPPEKIKTLTQVAESMKL